MTPERHPLRLERKIFMAEEEKKESVYLTYYPEEKKSTEIP